MLLTGDQILAEHLLKLETSYGKQAQVGYDLSAKSIQRIGQPGSESIGRILKDKTILNSYTPVDKTRLDGVDGWLLYPGVYEVTMWEGCHVKAGRTAFVKQRSSLYRNGTIINSPVFDPGFITENIGVCMYVNLPIFIEEDARVAQMYFYTNRKLKEDKLYNGQFQRDKQRTLPSKNPFNKK